MCLCVQVRSLEEKNGKLELKIREFCLKKKAVPHDFRKYLETISDLRAQVTSGYGKPKGSKSSVLLHINHASKTPFLCV